MMLCPVCGKSEFEEFGDYDICPVCKWENDGLQYNNPDYAGGANHLSLNEAKLEFLLLSNPVTHAETKKYQQIYDKEIISIYKKFHIQNYITENRKAEQQKQAFISARKKYIDKLRQLEQSAEI